MNDKEAAQILRTFVPFYKEQKEAIECAIAALETPTPTANEIAGVLKPFMRDPSRINVAVVVVLALLERKPT